MLTRDSLLLWVGIVGGVVIYLSGTKPIMEWGYYEYLSALGYLVSVVSAKLATSPLRGASK